MASEDINPAQVKAHSEQLILQAGGRVCDWLPTIERQQPRGQADLIGRALVLNALVNIAFSAPISAIKNWIDANGLAAHLSQGERDLLRKQNEDISEQQKSDLEWSIEALWALMWAGGLIPDLPVDTHVADTMVTLVPDLQKNEDGEKFTQRMRLRSYAELYQMLDLYYRAHWYTEDGRINGYDTADISSDIVMERRKALEWLLDASSDWDNISLNT